MDEPENTAESAPGPHGAYGSRGSQALNKHTKVNAHVMLRARPEEEGLLGEGAGDLAWVWALNDEPASRPGYLPSCTSA